jgi:hypothetical protein
MGADGMKRHLAARWSPKEERLALLLASGKAIKAAAAEVGIGERTAHTWLGHLHFRTLISELRSRMLDAAVGKLVESTTKAVDTLVCLLSSKRENIRLRAALGIVETMIRIREHVDFEQRILSLETGRENGTEDEDFAA